MSIACKSVRPVCVLFGDYLSANTLKISASKLVSARPKVVGISSFGFAARLPFLRIRNCNAQQRQARSVAFYHTTCTKMSGAEEKTPVVDEKG